MKHELHCASRRIVLGRRERGTCDCATQTEGFKSEYRVVCDGPCVIYSLVYEDRDEAEKRAAFLDQIHDVAVCGVHQIETRAVSAWQQLRFEGVNYG